MKWCVQHTGSNKWREDLAYVCETEQLAETVAICFNAGATNVTVSPIKNEATFASQYDLFQWANKIGVLP